MDWHISMEKRVLYNLIIVISLSLITCWDGNMGRFCFVYERLYWKNPEHNWLLYLLVLLKVKVYNFCTISITNAITKIMNVFKQANIPPSAIGWSNWWSHSKLMPLVEQMLLLGWSWWLHKQGSVLIVPQVLHSLIYIWCLCILSELGETTKWQTSHLMNLVLAWGWRAKWPLSFFWSHSSFPFLWPVYPF